MRLFIAIDPPGNVAEKLAAMQQMLADTKAAVRWVEAKDYHVTVKFLGEVAEDLLGELKERMARAAEEVAEFAVEVEGVDRFPEKGPARIIISRVISPDQRLTRLHRKIDSAIGGMGLPMDTRELVPHITLGRVKTNHGLNRLLRLVEKHDLDFFGSFTVAAVTLNQSIPEAEGMRHVVLHAAQLKATEQTEKQSSNESGGR